MTNLRTYRLLPAALALAALALAPVLVHAQADPAPAELSEEQKILYAIGFVVANNLTPLGLNEAELDWVTRGIADAALGRDARVDLQEEGPKIQGFAQKRLQASAAAEKAAGQEYLDREAAKEGARKLDSGLILTEMTPGTGDSPTAESQVTVHYHGTLRDGSVFDSSVERGQPATFGLNQVISCWTEGVQLMKVGGKSRLVCPSDIAYGDAGRPGIPPGAVLTFEVELLDIAAAPEPAPTEDQ